MGLKYLGDIIILSWARSWQDPFWNYCTNDVQYKVSSSLVHLISSFFGSLYKMSNINSIQTVLCILPRPHVYHLTYFSATSGLDIVIVTEKEN